MPIYEEISAFFKYPSSSFPTVQNLKDMLVQYQTTNVDVSCVMPVDVLVYINQLQTFGQHMKNGSILRLHQSSA